MSELPKDVEQGRTDLASPVDEKITDESVKDARFEQGEKDIELPYDEAASKRLVRKQDLRILPLACWTYLCCYLDRSNIGNAKVANLDAKHDMLDDLHTTDYKYTIALMLFFVAYIIFETPGVILMKKFRPSRWFGCICTLWGICTMCIGAVQGYSGLAGLRFTLGAIEASLFPGFVTVLSYWYRPEERSLRAALILASATLAGAFGGAMATGITYMDGTHGIYAWRWIFIIEGVPSVVTGVALYFLFPDFPEDCKWLTEEDRSLLNARLSGDNSAKAYHSLTWAEARKTILDWRLYLHYLCYIGVSPPYSSLSLFAPSIIKGMGYSKGVRPNLFSVPPWAVAWFVCVFGSFASDHFNRRGTFTAIFAGIGAIAYLALAAMPPGHFVDRYGLLIMATAGSFAAVPPLLGWLSSNVRGTTASTLVIPINVSFGGFGQIIGVWIYKASESPRYPTGHYVNFACLLVTSITCSVLILYYSRKNAQIRASGSKERLWAL